jgi:hypothetical protein
LDEGKEGLRVFENGKLAKKELSVCRAEHCSFDEMMAAVVNPQLLSKPARRFQGFYYARSDEIRAIMAQLRTEENKPALDEVGAFCVIDDGLPEYPAHAVLGYAKPDPDFWSKNDKQAARANLFDVMRRRGIYQYPGDVPFTTP